VKEYRLHSRVMYWLFVVALPCLMVGTGVGYVWIVTRSGQDMGPGWLPAVWFSAVLWGGYRSATMPHTIQVAETGIVRFVGTFRTLAVSNADIRRIKATGSFIELKHTKGKILLLQQFTGFHEFLTDLRRANPYVEMKGV
jgi:hypothetical protein